MHVYIQLQESFFVNACVFGPHNSLNDFVRYKFN